MRALIRFATFVKIVHLLYSNFRQDAEIKGRVLSWTVTAASRETVYTN